MNNYNDDFIRKKIQEDNYIPKKVNDVFENFMRNPSKFVDSDDEFIEVSENRNMRNRRTKENNKIGENNINSINNITNIKSINNSINTEINRQNISNFDNKNLNKYSNKIVFFNYQNMNKFLSVAAVFLTVVLVGMGTLLKNRPTEIEKIDIITKSAFVKNEELKFSNEQIIKYSENNLVKASLLGERKVAIQLKEEFIKLYNLDLSAEKQYEVKNINKNVTDVFVGCMISNELPFVLLVMEDGTAECIQILYDVITSEDKYEFNFFSQGEILGLNNVVGFEQKYRNYTNSEDKFYYINAIRNDGKKKEIELQYYNDWDDDTSYTFDSLNVSYLKQSLSKSCGTDYLEVTLIGDRKVVINLKERFIKEYELNLSTDNEFEVGNINKSVRDVFTGTMVTHDIPYVLLIMEDGTVECVQILNDVIMPSGDYQFNFYSQGQIYGLYNVVGFEQCFKKYTNSDEFYYYINAIRQDGKKTKIDLGKYNDWEESNFDDYEMIDASFLEQKDNENNSSEDIENSGNNDVTENNSSTNDTSNEETPTKEPNISQEDNSKMPHEVNKDNNSDNNESEKAENKPIVNDEYINDPRYFKDSLGAICLRSQKNNNYAYSIENNKLFRNNITEDTYSWIAEGVNSIRFDKDNNIIVDLNKEYTIHEIDYNVIFNEYDVSKSEPLYTKETEEFYIVNAYDGSISIRILEGGFQKLGLEGYTDLKENVTYNVVGANLGIVNKVSGYKYADSKVFGVEKIGPKNILTLVYARKDDVVVSINLEDAIKNNTFKQARTAIATGRSNIESLVKERMVGAHINGVEVEPYDTICAYGTENGEGYSQEVAYFE